jgi:hypothetical protein
MHTAHETGADDSSLDFAHCVLNPFPPAGILRTVRFDYFCAIR